MCDYQEVSVPAYKVMGWEQVRQYKPEEGKEGCAVGALVSFLGGPLEQAWVPQVPSKVHCLIQSQCVWPHTLGSVPSGENTALFGSS